MSERSHEALSRMLALRWEAPPSRLQEMVSRMPDFDPAPEVESMDSWERHTPEDVRGSTLLASDTPQLQTHSFSHADVSVHVQPWQRHRFVRIEGRIWLHETSEEPIAVLLVDDDHVLDSIHVEDGGHFTFQEAIASEWSIEFHLPGARVLVVEGGRP